MTKSELIYHRALRCRPAKRDTYVATHEALLADVGSKTVHGGRKTQHEALLAEAEYLQQTQRRMSALDRLSELEQAMCAPRRRSLWQIIKGWFA